MVLKPRCSERPPANMSGMQIPILLMSDSNIWGGPKNFLINIHDDSDVVDSRSTL